MVARLQASNTQPPAISGTFTWTLSAPRDAYVAAGVFNGNPPMEYLRAVPRSPTIQSAETLALRNYVNDMLKDGRPQGTCSEVRRYEQRQQGERFYVSCTFTSNGAEEYPPTIAAWNGEVGYFYQPTKKWAQRSTDYRKLRTWYGSPADVRTFSSHLPFPSISGRVSVRHEQVNGEDLVVLHEDLRDIYREYYLSAKDDYAPRRIVQRMKQKPAMPEHDVTSTVERETGRWPFRHWETNTVTIPAEPLKYLDWNHGQWDMDITIVGNTRRPDGQWFVSESVTSFPFFRRTEIFKAEGLSFAPVPETAFELHLSPDVHVRH